MGVGEYPLKFDFKPYEEAYNTGNLSAIFDALAEKLQEWTGGSERIAVQDFYIEGEHAWSFLMQNDKPNGKQNKKQNEKAHGKQNEKTNEKRNDNHSMDGLSPETLLEAGLIRTLAEGRYRVEYASARDCRSSTGRLKRTSRQSGKRINWADGAIVPVIPDLSFLDEKKPWYQPSVARRSDELWSTDRSAQNGSRPSWSWWGASRGKQRKRNGSMVSVNGSPRNPEYQTPKPKPKPETGNKAAIC